MSHLPISSAHTPASNPPSPPPYAASRLAYAATATASSFDIVVGVWLLSDPTATALRLAVAPLRRFAISATKKIDIVMCAYYHQNTHQNVLTRIHEFDSRT